MIVKANFEMEFDKGKFHKNKEYKARIKENKVFITTEEDKEQEFWDTEFSTFFTLLEK